jgi:hypothetical protein
MQLPLNVSPVSASFIGLQHLGIHRVRLLACGTWVGCADLLRQLPHVPSAVLSACLGKIEVIVIYFCNAVVNVHCEVTLDNWKVESSQRLQHRYPNTQQLLVLQTPSYRKRLDLGWRRTAPCTPAPACASLPLPRKEVIQPHLPVRLPCYDFTPITDPTLDACLPPEEGWPSGFRCCRLSWCDGRCVQDPGTYSPWCADPRLLATPASCRRVAACNPNYERVCRDWLPLAGWRPFVSPIVACVSPRTSGPC